MLEIKHKPTPVNAPKAGSSRFYVKTDGVAYLMDPAGTEVSMATGPTGPTGPAGPTGATGPAGPAAPHVIYVASLSDFPTPVANVITLVGTETYSLVADVDIGPNYILQGDAHLTATDPRHVLTGTHASRVVEMNGAEGSISNIVIFPDTVTSYAIDLTGAAGVLQNVSTPATPTDGSGVRVGAGSTLIAHDCVFSMLAGVGQSRTIDWVVGDHTGGLVWASGCVLEGNGAGMFAGTGVLNVRAEFSGSKIGGGNSVYWGANPPAALLFTGCNIDSALSGVSPTDETVDFVGCHGIPAVNRVTVAAATYTIKRKDELVGVTYTGTGAAVLTLPAANAGDSMVVRIKDQGRNASTFNITINPAGADTIEGAATLVVSSDGAAVSLYSDGVSGWFIY